MSWQNRIVGAGTEDPETLIPHPKNWRKHPKGQAAALEGAIEEIGWIQDIIINQRTGRMIDGHLRAELAIKNKEKSVPVKYVDLSEEEEEKALLTLDPISMMAEADKDRLSELLQNITSDNEKVNQLLEDIGREYKVSTKKAEEDDYEHPAEIETDIVRGDIYQLGRHRVMCGDSTCREDIERLMDGKKAKLFATDPPYGVAYGVETGSDIKYNPIANDDNDGEKLQAFLESVFSACLPSLEDNAAWYLWHAQMTQGFFAAAAAAAAADVLIHRQIIWIKPTLIMGHGDYHWKHELCFYGWRKGFRAEWYGDRKQSTVWEEGRENDHIHPTQKPVGLFSRPLQFNTQLGDIALDPFLGSGTTLIACEQLNRVCYGCEISPQYCQVIIDRWEKLTGEKRIKIDRVDAE